MYNKVESIKDSEGYPICWRVFVMGEDIYGNGLLTSAFVLFESDDVTKVEAFLAIIKAAEDLAFLMQYAARSGTSRSVFRKVRRKKLFKAFEIGAKTGTINDKLDRFKYDWITAIVLAPDGNKRIAIGVLGVHGKILGTRSTELARAIIDYYFRI